MKKFFLPLLAFLVICCHHKTENKQNNDQIISMDGIGELKLEMKQAEVEKLLGQQLILKNARDTTDYWNDTATVRYKDIDLQLYFQREYPEENNFYMYLIGLRTGSPLCKTGSGIGVGSEQSKIIADYDGSYLSLSPEFDTDTVVTKSKTRSLVNVRNDYGNRQIIFYLSNKKVTAFEAAIVFHDSE